MKRIFKVIILVVLAIVVIFAGFMWYTQNQLSKLSRMPISNVDLVLTDDGTYKGDYSVFPVSVKLDVTVKDHRITEILILEHITGQGEKAEAIIEEVIKNQSLQVDSISGATYSSKVILKAIEKALTEKAK